MADNEIETHDCIIDLNLADKSRLKESYTIEGAKHIFEFEG